MTGVHGGVLAISTHPTPLRPLLDEYHSLGAAGHFRDISRSRVSETISMLLLRAVHVVSGIAAYYPQALTDRLWHTHQSSRFRFGLGGC